MILVNVPYSCLSAAFYQEKFRQKRAEMQKFGSRHLLRNDLYTPSDIWWLQTFFKSTLINLTFLTWVGKQTAYHAYAHYQFWHQFTSFLCSDRLSSKYRWLMPKYYDKVIALILALTSCTLHQIAFSFQGMFSHNELIFFNFKRWPESEWVW